MLDCIIAGILKVYDFFWELLDLDDIFDEDGDL